MLVLKACAPRCPRVLPGSPQGLKRWSIAAQTGVFWAPLAIVQGDSAWQWHSSHSAGKDGFGDMLCNNLRIALHFGLESDKEANSCHIRHSDRCPAWSIGGRVAVIGRRRLGGKCGYQARSGTNQASAANHSLKNGHSQSEQSDNAMEGLTRKTPWRA